MPKEKDNIQLAATMKTLRAKVSFKGDPGTDKEEEPIDDMLHGEDPQRKFSRVK